MMHACMWQLRPQPSTVLTAGCAALLHTRQIPHPLAQPCLHPHPPTPPRATRPQPCPIHAHAQRATTCLEGGRPTHSRRQWPWAGWGSLSRAALSLTAAPPARPRPPAPPSPARTPQCTGSLHDGDGGRLLMTAHKCRTSDTQAPEASFIGADSRAGAAVQQQWSWGGQGAGNSWAGVPPAWYPSHLTDDDAVRGLTVVHRDHGVQHDPAARLHLILVPHLSNRRSPSHTTVKPGVHARLPANTRP
jgi:hypothetical protein